MDRPEDTVLARAQITDIPRSGECWLAGRIAKFAFLVQTLQIGRKCDYGQCLIGKFRTLLHQ
jgi:hypothetical protein